MSDQVSEWPAVVLRFAEAIAEAEGFYVAGSKSSRQNNPGDLADQQTGSILTFSTLEDGWYALRSQVYKMFFGGSAHYNPAMTIQQVGYIYADGLHDPTGAANWSNNVARALGVTIDTTLNTLAANMAV